MTHKRKGKKLKSTPTVVIFPFYPDKTDVLEREFNRLNVARGTTSKFNQRFTKNGYINGRSTPFLAIDLASGNFTHTYIEGLSSLYVAYVNFIGKNVTLTPWERIRIDDKPERSFFETLLLTDYEQDTEVDWATFKCKFNHQIKYFYLSKIILFYLFI